MLGTSTVSVKVNNILEVGGSASNITHTGTNNWNGDIAFEARANTSQANGNNAGVVLGTNVLINLSGATTVATNTGFVAERAGSYHILFFDGAGTNVFLNESGVDTTSANRIITGTGGSITMTNQPAWAKVIYRSSRWYLLDHSD